ncbi:RDD family protein [Neolewinella aurantiaca]|uniref:RDD family protein n=1 Tax=Neolewinella aurantiaca TaxID=2602767 RepID=A0A5C7FQ24_9BACT|nr:RDD family protein [Neolewinella aurantiaca]TXF88573.1 RDD family protein [Neolewinella aurantiaca]
MYSSDETIDSDFLSPDEVQPTFVGFGPRFGAALLDVLIMIPVTGAAIYFSAISMNVNVYFLLILVSILYKPVCEKVLGGTPGKLILKMKVVGKGGVALSWGQAIMRYLPWLVGALFNVYMQYNAFQIPGIEDNDGFADYSRMVQEYQIENGGIMLSIVQSLIGLLPLVSTLFVLGNKKKQAAHDILAETYVVSTKPKY